jgi:hypothetical protein
MTRDEIFEAWAPTAGIWSNWVKPALFAQLPRTLPPDVEAASFDLSWLPPARDRVSLVVDLPGSGGVHFGLALARLGYRPVPLFNARLPPETGVTGAPTTEIAVVRVEPILAALTRGAEPLRGSPPPLDAPPAFLIDADRQATHTAPLPGAFDNRSVVFVTDFPSAATLARHGISRAVLVRERPGPIGSDLRYALQVWQQAGVRLELKVLSEPGPPAPLSLPRARWWSGLRHRFMELFGFWRTESGDFGGYIPHPSNG